MKGPRPIYWLVNLEIFPGINVWRKSVEEINGTFLRHEFLVKTSGFRDDWTKFEVIKSWNIDNLVVWAEAVFILRDVYQSLKVAAVFIISLDNKQGTLIPDGTVSHFRR